MRASKLPSSPPPPVPSFPLVPFHPSHLHLPAHGHHDLARRPLASGPRILHLAYHVHAVEDTAEDDVFVVEEGCRDLLRERQRAGKGKEESGGGEEKGGKEGLTVVMKNWEPLVLGPEF